MHPLTLKRHRIDHLSRKQIVAYSTGNLAARVYFAFNTFVLSPYLQLFTNNDALIGYLSNTRSFEQAFVQPIVGARSDRTWTRFGRRAPFFLTTMSLVALLFIVHGIILHD